MKRYIHFDPSKMAGAKPSNPSDDEKLASAMIDPDLMKVILKGFLKLQNDIIDLKNIVEQPPTPTPHRTPQQVKAWFIDNLKGT